MARNAACEHEEISFNDVIPFPVIKWKNNETDNVLQWHVLYLLKLRTQILEKKQPYTVHYSIFIIKRLQKPQPPLLSVILPKKQNTHYMKKKAMN